MRRSGVRSSSSPPPIQARKPYQIRLSGFFVAPRSSIQAPGIPRYSRPNFPRTFPRSLCCARHPEEGAAAHRFDRRSTSEPPFRLSAQHCAKLASAHASIALRQSHHRPLLFDVANPDVASRRAPAPYSPRMHVSHLVVGRHSSAAPSDADSVPGSPEALVRKSSHPSSRPMLPLDTTIVVQSSQPGWETGRPRSDSESFSVHPARSFPALDRLVRVLAPRLQERDCREPQG